MKQIHAGSVKNVFAVENEGQLEFEFSDRISVFDKLIPSEIPLKGETLCKTAVFWLKKAEEMGIKTHFIQQTAPNRIRVHKVDIIRDYSAISAETRRYLIPCEFILRHYAAGSLYDRLLSGAVSLQEAGFSAGQDLEYGMKLPSPLFEFTTKLEAVDSSLTEKEVYEMSGIGPDVLDGIRETCLALDGELQAEVFSRGLVHVDGKKEFAMDANRNLMLVDVFGTADEDRFWDLEEYRRGKCVELSKEFVRKHYRESGYKDQLYQARADQREEPPIPPLPQEIVDRASTLYIDIYEKITGQTFGKG